MWKYLSLAPSIVWLSALFLATPTSEAAEIRLSTFDRCDLEMIGVIDGSEVKQLRAMLTDDMDSPVLCMNSGGGSIAGGLALFEFLSEVAIPTAIPQGWRCESSCAVAFMGGRAPVGMGMGIRQSWTKPVLSPGGLLGFHAPWIELPPGQTYSTAQVQSAFRIAQEASTALYRASLAEAEDWRPFNEYLLSRLFETPWNEMFYIETIADAVLGGIELGELPLPEVVGVAELTNLCDAAFLAQAPFVFRTPRSPAIDSWRRIRFEGPYSDSEAQSMRDASASQVNGEVTVRVDGYDQRSAMRAIRCEATLRENAFMGSGSYAFSYWSGNGAEVTFWEILSFELGVWEQRDNVPMAKMTVPLWYLHHPDTPLSTLSHEPTDDYRPVRFDLPVSFDFQATHAVHSPETGFLNLRDAPGNSASILRRLDQSTHLQVELIDARGWASVKTSDGASGWVYSRYIVGLD